VSRDLAAELAAERSVIGAVLLEPSKLRTVLSALTSEDFLELVSRDALDGLISLDRSQSPIDVVSLADQMSRLSGKFHGAELLELVKTTPTAENIEHYIGIVRRASALRRISKAAAETLSMVKDNADPEAILEKSAEKLAAIATRRSDKLTSIGDVMPRVLEAIDERAANPGSRFGITCGIPGLDGLTTGAKPGQMVVIAGDNGAGKTALLNQYALHSSLTQDAAWLMFSLEMMNEEQVERWLAREGSLDSYYLSTGNLSGESSARLMSTAMKLSKLAIHMEDSVTSIAEIISISMGWAARYPAERKKAIAVDYLQLARGLEGVKRDEMVADISTRLKALAKRLRCPVFALAQLNRSGKTAERPPTKHDLRDSGRIEDDADKIILGYRPTGVQKPDGSYDTDWIVDKNRGGPTGVVNTKFTGRFYRFDELEGFGG
jgi:replicative DNA helicase